MKTFAAMVLATMIGRGPATPADGDEVPLQVVVMDPLSAPLSCPCVAGYAQRKYEKLGEHLEKELGRPVEIQWAESLKKALDGFEAKELPRRADLVIGKDSVVRHDAKKQKLKAEVLARLSGKDGATTQHGLIVVRTEDPAQDMADLAGYHIVYGTADADEKHAAALELLKQHGIEPEEELECVPSCSTGAGKILEMPAEARVAAVVSSYARPLLEGCGTVPKGALRVVGKTKDVPFITAFVTDGVDAEARAGLKAALLGVNRDPFLMLALETSKGFVAPPAQKKTEGPPRRSLPQPR